MTVDGYPSDKDQLEAAVGLQSLGLTAGDKVAVIGDGSFAIWARLARLKIVFGGFIPGAGKPGFLDLVMGTSELGLSEASRHWSNGGGGLEPAGEWHGPGMEKSRQH